MPEIRITMLGNQHSEMQRGKYLYLHGDEQVYVCSALQKYSSTNKKLI